MLTSAFCLLALLAPQAAPPPAAQAPKDPWHRFEFSVGAMIADLGSSVQVDSQSGLGVSVDIEEALGLEASLFQVRAGMSYEFVPGHRLWLDYVNLSRSASRTLLDDITIGGTTYPTGTTVHSDFDLHLVNLVYGYSLIRDDRVNLALTFGMHGMQTQFKIEGQSVATESENFFLPIPLPGIRMNVLLAKDLYFKQHLEFLWIGLDNFEGLMVDAMVGIEWAAFENVGFGLAYNHLRISLDVETEFATIDFTGKYEFDAAGFLFYTTLYF